MKRLSILITFALLSNYSFGQNSTFGAKAGINLSKFTGANVGSVSTKIGFNIGLIGNFKVLKNLSIQSEFLYNSIGAKFKNVDANLNYFSIPLMAKISTPIGLRFLTGPQFSLLLSSKASSGGSSGDLNNFFKSTDLSWVFGAEYALYDYFGIHVRYCRGLNKIIFDNSDVKNSNFQFGIFFHFGKPQSK